MKSAYLRAHPSDTFLMPIHTQNRSSGGVYGWLRVEGGGFPLLQGFTPGGDEDYRSATVSFLIHHTLQDGVFIVLQSLQSIFSLLSYLFLRCHASRNRSP